MKKEVIASYVLSNNASINIHEVIYGIDSFIKWSFNNKRVITSKIRYGAGGSCDEYFIALGRKIPLCECMIIR